MECRRFLVVAKGVHRVRFVGDHDRPVDQQHDHGDDERTLQDRMLSGVQFPGVAVIDQKKTGNGSVVNWAVGADGRKNCRG